LIYWWVNVEFLGHVDVFSSTLKDREQHIKKRI